MDKSSFGKLQLIFALGLFTLMGQTLLFRDFLSVFEGNELSTGLFFASWLAWIAAGAALGRFLWRLTQVREGFFEHASLLYVPAFLLQDYLLLNARAFSGVANYEVFPIVKLGFLTFFGNAPMSLLTGFLFVLACPWAGGRAPVSRVYIAESLGSFAGALLVTLMLAAGMEQENVFLTASALLSFSAALSIRSWQDIKFSAVLGKAFIPLLMVFISCVILCSGLGRAWAAVNKQSQWERLLPDSRCAGSFATAQAKYLYGMYRDQFVVSAWGSVCENLPNDIAAREMLTLLLSQNPNTENVLVIGANQAGLCLKLRELPQMRRVSWLSSDPEYPARLGAVMPEDFRKGMEGVEMPGMELRGWLKGSGDKFDMILLALPQPNSLSSNRCYTREFFLELKKRLSPAGVFAVSFPGGENFMGSELSYFGASLYCTLSEAFEKIVLKPGEGSIFFASGPEGRATADTRELSERIRSLNGLKGVLPADSIGSFFPEDRERIQFGRYKELLERTPKPLLCNSDDSPKSFLYSLLLTLKQGGAGGFLGRDFAQRMLSSLWAAAALSIIMGILVRALGRRQRGLASGDLIVPISSFWLAPGDAMLLVFGAAFSGMLLNLLLLFQWQICFGSLFLYFGVISSLFMLGLCGGALLGRKFSGVKRRSPVLLGFCGLLLLILGMKMLPAAPGIVLFGILFLLAGASTGFFVPMAGEQISLAGGSDAHEGMLIGSLDNLGGALGGLLTALLLLPFLGRGDTLILLSLGVLTVALLLITSKANSRLDSVARPMLASGQFLAWLGATCVIFSILCHNGQRQTKNLKADDDDSPRAHSGLLFPGESLALLDKASAPRDCYVLIEKDGSTGGYIFRTEDFCSGVNGFGGPIKLLVRTDKSGVLENFVVLENKETPEYFRKLIKNKPVFFGKNIFSSSLSEPLDTVSGATISSKALSETLRTAGSRFAAEILNNEKLPERDTRIGEPTQNLLLIVSLVLAGAALLLRMALTRNLRLAFLVVVFLFCGIIFGMQYSSQQVFSLIFLELPPFSFTLSLLLVLLPVVLTILFGNFYCGYLCPFGALQELVGEFGLKLQPGKLFFRIGRALKYFILLIIVVAASFGIVSQLADVDILRTFFIFDIKSSGLTFWFVAFILASSFFYLRFWCRALCPSGAFLALLGSLRLLGRFLPLVKPGRCDLGIYRAGELDCISCDRCRMPAARHQAREEDRIKGLIYMALLLGALAFMVFFVLRNFKGESSQTVLDSLPERQASIKTVNSKDTGAPLKISAPEAKGKAPEPISMAAPEKLLNGKKTEGKALKEAATDNTDNQEEALAATPLPAVSKKKEEGNPGYEAKIKRLIQDGRLSGHKASYWQELPE
ncbi:MAG: hypothetical protein A2X49_05270 [Lentisphaerae bacterium GWF2_52_8]|nr:MAG: hypothetical protein A2X49_05270 [Lentisphaerae bacterium GWF2_52_8]